MQHHACELCRRCWRSWPSRSFSREKSRPGSPLRSLRIANGNTVQRMRRRCSCGLDRMSKSWIWATRIGELASKTGQLVWAADSRRFAFNSRKGGKYYGCDLYELAEARWKKLPGLEHNNGV